MMEVMAAAVALETTVTMLASAMEGAASEVAASGAAAKALAAVVSEAVAAVWATGVAAAEAPPTLYTCGVCPSG